MGSITGQGTTIPQAAEQFIMEEHMIISKAVAFKSNDPHSHKYSQKFGIISLPLPF